MAHYAFLDENNIVTNVINGRNENEIIDGVNNWEEYYGNLHNQKCVRTSFNTISGLHILGGVPFRKNFAGIGFKYDKERDAFIPPKPPFNSWILDEETCNWKAPLPYPEDGKINIADPKDGPLYEWNEDIVNWSIVD